VAPLFVSIVKILSYLLVLSYDPDRTRADVQLDATRTCDETAGQGADDGDNYDH
jgi:hypothetical protein